MTTPTSLHTSLLRPAILHILRASGFHSSRASVIDTLTDLAARYLLLIASKTAEHTYDRTIACATDDDPSHPQLYYDEYNEELSQQALTPSMTDVRLGLSDAFFFTPTTTASEQAWAETLRKPLSAYPAGAREKERRRRDAEDTRDIREFVEWATGPAAREIRRIAGQLHEESTKAPDAGAANIRSVEGEENKAVQRDDYISLLKRKHGGKEPEARYAGTLIGEGITDSRMLKIEGGPATLNEWVQGVKRKHEETAT